MSRHFEASTNDELQVSAGNVSGIDGGPITYVAVINFDGVSAFQRLTRARTAALAEVWASAIDTGQMYYATGAGFVGGISGLSASTWYLYAVTKATGASTVRDHLCVMSTDTWTHADRGSVGDGTGPVDNLLFSDTGARLDAYVAAIAVYSSVLNDAAIEALRPGLAAWMSAGPAALWRFNDTPVDDLTGGGANQTAISGTTVDTGVEPPSFSYSLTSSSFTPTPIIGPGAAVIRASVW